MVNRQCWKHGRGHNRAQKTQGSGVKCAGQGVITVITLRHLYNFGLKIENSSNIYVEFIVYNWIYIMLLI